MENTVLEEKIIDILVEVFMFGRLAERDKEAGLPYAFLAYMKRKDIMKICKEAYGKVSEK